MGIGTLNLSGVNTYTGPVLNEVLARSPSSASQSGPLVGFVELFNPGTAAFDLAGMSLSLNHAEPGQWEKPAPLLGQNAAGEQPQRPGHAGAEEAAVVGQTAPTRPTREGPRAKAAAGSIAAGVK